MNKDQYYVQILRILYLHGILLPLDFFYSQKKRIEESFMMVVEANDYVKQFPRYQQFSVWWLGDHRLIYW